MKHAKLYTKDGKPILNSLGEHDTICFGINKDQVQMVSKNLIVRALNAKGQYIKSQVKVQK